MTAAVTTAQLSAPGVSLGFKNRIINGGMTIDQRNAGASVTVSSDVYTLDRWKAIQSQASKYTVQQNAGSVTPPPGFTKYLGVTVTSAVSIGSGDYFELVQQIEGLNVADLAWGTASAKSVTLSFQVYSSLTGTFGGAIGNGSGTRKSYPFSYSIPAANTWTSISITVPGCTDGTWATDNAAGLALRFSLGVGSNYSTTAGSWVSGVYDSATGATSVVGTNGATFYITGVQLEVGTAATQFEFRDYGRELIMCQRYFEMVNIAYNQQHAIYFDGSQCNSMYFPFQVTKRTTPTCTATTASKQFCNYGGGAAVNATTVSINANLYAYQYQYAGTSMGNGPIMNMAATTVASSAEL